MKYLSTTFLLIAFLSLSLYAQEPKWLSKIKKITPIYSTEKDVEKLFGKPVERNVNSVKYELKEGYLNIEYATGVCGQVSDYLLPEGSVEYVHFRLKEDFEFNKLKINLTKFVREESDDTENVSFKSRELGIRYGTYIQYIEEVDYDKRPLILMTVSFYPAKKYDYLECPRIK